jgi:6-phosphogluconolactonase
VDGRVVDWHPVRAASRPELIVDAHPMERAGEHVSKALAAVLDRKSTVRLAIPGGSALAAVPRARTRLGEAWRRVALTWVDERCVPVASDESNRGAAARLGLVSAGSWRCDGPEPAIVVPLYEDGEVPERALERARSRLHLEFGNRLDVVLLGMGSDGHIASLFPGRMDPTPDRVAQVSDSPKPPSRRITLSRAFLATAEKVILVAAGEAKRDAIQRLSNGDAELPAQGLPGLLVVTDLVLDSDAESSPAGGGDV